MVPVLIYIIFSEYTIEMYKCVSHLTRDETALVPGTSLATHLVPIYQFLDTHFSKADIVLIGEHEQEYLQLTTKVSKIRDL